MCTGAERMGRKRVAGATPMSIVKADLMVVMTAVERRLDRLQADALWFSRVPVSLLNLPNHARVHV